MAKSPAWLPFTPTDEDKLVTRRTTSFHKGPSLTASVATMAVSSVTPFVTPSLLPSVAPSCRPLFADEIALAGEEAVGIFGRWDCKRQQMQSSLAWTKTCSSSSSSSLSSSSSSSSSSTSSPFRFVVTLDNFLTVLAFLLLLFCLGSEEEVESEVEAARERPALNESGWA